MVWLTIFLLNKYGINGYGGMIVNKQVASWFFWILSMGMFIYVNISVKKFFANQKNELQDQKKTLQ